MSEREAFEKMIRQHLGVYFEDNIADLIRGKIRIEDDGTMIKIYKVDFLNKNPRHYDIGIVY